MLFIIVDEASAGAYYGSIVAAPYGKEIFTRLFDYLGEEKQDKSVQVEYVEMPDLVDKSIVECISILKKLDLGFEIDGDGEYIARQLPPVGTRLQKGTTILLVTN